MLENIEDYIYIRDKMLFAEKNGEVVERATIDTDVLGIREQVRLPRLVDQYYLRELSALHSDALSNSVEFDWPVPLNSKLPTPPLSKYVDEDKLLALSIDNDVDIFNFTGGEDPDIDALQEQYDQAHENYLSANDDALSAYEKAQEDLLSSLNADLDKIREDREKIDEQFSDIEEIRYEALEEAQTELDESLHSINEEIQDVNAKRNSGQITEAEWNSERNRLQEEIYDAYSNNRNAVADIELEYRSNYATWQELLRDNSALERDRTAEYNSSLEEALSSYNDKLQKNLQELNETKRDLFLESNAHVGDAWYGNREKLEQQMNELSIYPAENHVSCTIPWVPANKISSFIEYNDRLYADWEKIRWKKIPFANVEKVVDGYWETYTASQSYNSIETDYGDLPGYTINNEFNRFTNGDTIFYERTYENAFDDMHQESEYTFDDVTFKMRLGNRHEAGNIQRVKAIVSFDGDGEGIASTRKDFGTMYGIVDCVKVGVQQEGYLERWDEENDNNLSYLQEIDDEYNDKKLSVDHQYNLDIEGLELACQTDIDKLSSDMYDQARDLTQGCIDGLEDTLAEANRKAEAGEDNTVERETISNRLNQLRNDIAQLQMALDDQISERRLKLRNDKRTRNDKYSNDISQIGNEWENRTTAENTRHATELRNIQNDFHDEREDWQEAARQIYDEAMQAAQDELNAFGERYADEKKTQNEDFVNKWNDHFGEDYPELKFPEGYNIVDRGFDYRDLPSQDERQWAFDNIQLPIYNWQVSWYQPMADAEGKKTSAEAEAKADLAESLGEFEDFLPNHREMWTFDASKFQAFADDFTSEQEYEFKSVWGDKAVSRCQVIAVYAEIDYGAQTGVEYPDYEAIDSGDDEDNEEEANNDN